MTRSFFPGRIFFTRVPFEKPCTFSRLSLARCVPYELPEGGRRAEDPFRGLRAGPARSSPRLFLSLPNPLEIRYPGKSFKSDESCSPEARPSTYDLCLPQRPHVDFADKTMGTLGDQHGHSVRHVVGLQKRGRVSPRVRRKLRGHATGTDDAYPNTTRPQVLCHAGG